MKASLLPTQPCCLLYYEHISKQTVTFIIKCITDLDMVRPLKSGVSLFAHRSVLQLVIIYCYMRQPKVQADLNMLNQMILEI
jgi:hypothetical protein